MKLHVQPDQFTITVEVVPPAGSDAKPLLVALERIGSPLVDGFSVASNPVAKPRMSALALAVLIQQRTARPAILHGTTRDHNRLSTQSLLWGARALGISTLLAATGDYVALGDRARTTTVRDLDVYDLVAMARKAGLHTGVVLDPRTQGRNLEHEIRRLERKVKAGAQFAVTQPVYDEASAAELAERTRAKGVPVLLGILPLRTARHAAFLNRNVAGISVPRRVLERMERSATPGEDGIAGARDMLQLARDEFAGVCIMPPFDDFSTVDWILCVS